MRSSKEPLPIGPLRLDVLEATEPLFAASAAPDLTPPRTAALAPGTRSVIQHADPFTDSGEQFVALVQTVRFADESQTLCLSPYWVAEAQVDSS